MAKTDITGTLVYATYLGGSSYDNATGIAATKSSLNPDVYVAGNTRSLDFPVTVKSFIVGSKTYPGWQQQLGQPGTHCTPQSCVNAFVTRLDSNGFIIFSTYLGDYHEGANGVAVDPNGNVYVTGYASQTFPTYPPAPAPLLQRSPTGSFVTKLAPTGAPVYSTFFPTAWTANTYAIAVDANGSAYVTGMTGYDGLATSNAYQKHLVCPAIGCQTNAFVAKLSPDGSSLDYFTYLGAGQDTGYAIDVDDGGNAYVTGYTTLAGFPVTPGAPEPLFANGCMPSVGCGPILGDAFVTEVNATGTALVYSTFLGGDSFDIGYGIKVDSAGYAYVAGATASESTLHDPHGFPAINAVQQLNNSNYHDASGEYHVNGAGPFGGCCDAFLVKVTPGATSFEYSTFLGGFNEDWALGVAIDGTGNAWIAGKTAANDFPVKNALQNGLGGGWDAFVALITAPNDSRPGSGGNGGGKGGGGKGGGGGCGGKICQ
ncbi:MAG: SBBP repeat-containing protein [Acidobacteriaceae bacterium]|nr:SBBP repeat-containing protein [Acidobacteriaceae bacterium]